MTHAALADASNTNAATARLVEFSRAGCSSGFIAEGDMYVAWAV